MSLVASMMKITEINREKISSVKRVKNSTMFDRENTLSWGKKAATIKPSLSGTVHATERGGGGARQKARGRAEGWGCTK